MRRDQGFSLIEMMIAMTVMLSVTAAVFSLMNPAQGSFATQPEVSDMQQRLRVGADTLYKDLVMAGNGAYQGSMSGSLLYMFTPVMPFRQGTVNDDPPGTFKDDTITLMYVPPTFAQTSLSTKGPSLTSAEIGVNAEPGCPDPKNDPLCGFKSGMTVIIYDDSGNYDLFTITNVQPNALHLQHNNDSLTYTAYEANKTKIVQANYFEYYLNAATNQLMFYDGSGAPDVPVVDNVVGLKFEYYGDPQPPTIKNSASPWQTTYGPAPKAADPPPAGSPWPANENCVFAPNAGLAPVPKLATLGAANSALVQLTAAQLKDGPWCPTAANVNRWDADLLRIRKIGVTLRVQAAAASLRGPASELFTRGGTSKSGSKWVPDQEIHFMVSPRNLNLGR